METSDRHDSAYELKTVLLLAVGFGLVGLDRWMVAPLFPYMMRELGLNFQQLGNLIGVLAVAWGAWAIASGPISDRIGRKQILIRKIAAIGAFMALALVETAPRCARAAASPRRATPVRHEG